MSSTSTELVLARATVVAAAKTWYRNRGNVEAPLAAAVRRLEELERPGCPRCGGAVGQQGSGNDPDYRPRGDEEPHDGSRCSSCGGSGWARSLDLPCTGT